jgi:ArsR family metal-binding transcriptional regulator
MEGVMLLQSYRKEIFRPECNPGFESLHCFAHLKQDVGEVLSYLNAELGGFEYVEEPPSVTFRSQGKIITVHPKMIAINALKDEAEADKILEWLRREINEAWDKRESIEPSYDSAPRPQVFEILKMLPGTNCRKCGQATCMVFAAQAAEGGRSAEDCPELGQESAARLREYLGRF